MFARELYQRVRVFFKPRRPTAGLCYGEKGPFLYTIVSFFANATMFFHSINSSVLIFFFFPGEYLKKFPRGRGPSRNKVGFSTKKAAALTIYNIPTLEYASFGYWVRTVYSGVHSGVFSALRPRGRGPEELKRNLFGFFRCLRNPKFGWQQ